jgi:hypothetical protein
MLSLHSSSTAPMFANLPPLSPAAKWMRLQVVGKNAKDTATSHERTAYGLVWNRFRTSHTARDSPATAVATGDPQIHSGTDKRDGGEAGVVIR